MADCRGVGDEVVGVTDRAEQIAETLKVTASLREQGWSEATVEVTRGGTYRVHVRAEGDKVVRPQFATGRK
jgi:hypothetical protein